MKFKYLLFFLAFMFLNVQCVYPMLMSGDSFGKSFSIPPAGVDVNGEENIVTHQQMLANEVSVKPEEDGNEEEYSIDIFAGVNGGRIAKVEINGQIEYFQTKDKTFLEEPSHEHYDSDGNHSDYNFTTESAASIEYLNIPERDELLNLHNQYSNGFLKDSLHRVNDVLNKVTFLPDNDWKPISEKKFDETAINDEESLDELSENNSISEFYDQIANPIVKVLVKGFFGFGEE